MKTRRCEPTLTDTQVLKFCRNGFLLLEGVVPDETNRRTTEYLESDSHYEPSGILNQDWFVENVILNPQAAGAVRSLLGDEFGLPIVMSNHRAAGKLPVQSWHRDGGSRYGPELNYLQVFYYPQAVDIQTGPTEALPGSHFLFALQHYMGHYGKIRGAVPLVAPAGSIFITVYSIWHRRSAKMTDGTRNLLKYNYWRTQSPRRDWVIEPDFDFATADYSSLDGPTFRAQHEENADAARMFFWLCGLADKFKAIGGQGWPITKADSKFLDTPVGYPLAD